MKKTPSTPSLAFTRFYGPLVALAMAWPLLTPHAATAGELERELGRSESRILSAPYPLLAGRTVWQCALAERLELSGYRRVRRRPEQPGELFWGQEVFWIFRRAHRLGGDDHRAELLGLALGRDGEILHGLDAKEEPFDLEPGRLWLEPEVLAEAIGEERATRTRIVFDELPKHVWQAVLAAEDARRSTSRRSCCLRSSFSRRSAPSASAPSKRGSRSRSSTRSRVFRR